MPELGEKQYEWLCSLVKERLSKFRPDVLDRDGAFPAVDGKVLMRRIWTYMVSLSVLGALLVSLAYGFTRVQVPGRKDKIRYLFGSLKRGSLLDGVLGTAEEWLHRGRLYRNPRTIFQRMEE